MGLFSWKTQDTNRSIPCDGNSSRPTFPVTMTDNKGNVWNEPNYEGYGEFGGKDYYQLVAEMSRPKECTGVVDDDRLIGINLCHGTGAIKNKITGKVYRSSGHDFFNWETEILPHGLSANASLKLTGNWERFEVVETNLFYPNLTEDKNHTWSNEEPENCEYQGYFYHDDWEEEEY